MTDKLIINGIDVSKCFYIILHNPPTGQGTWGGAIHRGACKVYSKDCKYNKDCYYKQLKRLQNQYNAVVEQNRQLQRELKPKTYGDISTNGVNWTDKMKGEN